MELKMIELKDIVTNPLQPRQEFNREKLQELADSIYESELLQPIVVRKQKDKFEIVAGERRFKAFQILKEPKIPAIVRVIKDDVEALEKSLIENWQREDLTDSEKESSLNQLWESKRYSSLREMGRKTGIPHQEISGYIRSKEERKIVEKDFQDKLTYVDFHETRPLKESPEVRKILLEKRAKGEIESKSLREISQKLVEFPEPEQQMEILEEFEQQEKQSKEIFNGIVEKQRRIAQKEIEPEHFRENNADIIRLEAIKDIYNRSSSITSFYINRIESSKEKNEAIQYIKKIVIHWNKVLIALDEVKVIDIAK